MGVEAPAVGVAGTTGSAGCSRGRMKLSARAATATMAQMPTTNHSVLFGCSSRSEGLPAGFLGGSSGGFGGSGGVSGGSGCPSGRSGASTGTGPPASGSGMFSFSGRTVSGSSCRSGSPGSSRGVSAAGSGRGSSCACAPKASASGCSGGGSSGVASSGASSGCGAFSGSGSGTAAASSALYEASIPAMVRSTSLSSRSGLPNMAIAAASPSPTQGSRAMESSMVSVYLSSGAKDSAFFSTSPSLSPAMVGMGMASPFMRRRSAAARSSFVISPAAQAKKGSLPRVTPA